MSGADAVSLRFTEADVNCCSEVEGLFILDRKVAGCIGKEREMTLDDPGSDCRWVGFTVHVRVVLYRFDCMRSCGGRSCHPTDRMIIAFTVYSNIRKGLSHRM